ncbi:hypothetical protein OIU74_017957 [Salix koriyanagi]|uniref:Uncharacterized protein n=1 Tax=Salix koriyanagi TaxID=2511006 RepID=A0A9Q0WQH1_9ROSI|nr:hypothetical protein OIU74_017957 [Salix koriyanagi]
MEWKISKINKIKAARKTY